MTVRLEWSLESFSGFSGKGERWWPDDADFQLGWIFNLDEGLLCDEDTQVDFSPATQTLKVDFVAEA